MSIINKTKAILGLLKVEPITDEVSLLAACQEFARDQIARDAKQIQLAAELQIVKDQHEGAIETLNSKLAHQLKRLRAWADANRATHFKGRQSFVIAGNELAFHKSPGAIGFTEGHDAESVVEGLLALEGEAGDLIREQLLRVKAELDKKAALRMLRSKSEGYLELQARGVKITEDESFDFTPAREALPAITETADSEPEGRKAA